MPAVQPITQLPTAADVAIAHGEYLRVEGRDVVYRVARDLVERGYRRESGFTVGDAVAVLLLSWNAAFYRPRPMLVRTLADDLDRLIAAHDPELRGFRSRDVTTYHPPSDADVVARVYRGFVDVLWPVGTAKALHVIAPSFFPLWDDAIARAFRLQLSPREASVAAYLRLMEIGRAFSAGWRSPDALKALDEWAYVRFTVPRRR
jgi:hypothetical protein